MAGSECIEVERREAILEIRIARPEKKNALTAGMYAAMNEALDSAEGDDEVRVVILRGTDGVFTAGNDLREFVEGFAEGGEDSAVFGFMRRLIEMDTVLMAAVEGWAVGIGTTLLLHCDLVYAAPNATFQLPFVNLGIVPEAASSVLMPRAMGLQRASQLLLFGDRFDAEQALEFGMINEIIGAEALYQEVERRAQQLCSRPPQALRASKRLIREGLGRQRALEVMRHEARVLLERMDSGEVAEIAAAMLARGKKK